MNNPTRLEASGSGLRLAELALVLMVVNLSAVAQGQFLLYSTGFEADEGYGAALSLTGQEQWIGSGGDGVVTEFFPGYGQQAYIGFVASSGAQREFHNVYRPVQLARIARRQAVVKFSVMMQIVDSTSSRGPWDDFRWSVYNTNGTRLFSLDFDNQALLVSYLLDDERGFVSTGAKFDTRGYYDLEISMNFARNLWSATLNDEVVAHSQPITTLGSSLSLGDVDAVWSMRNPQFPGDNYMVFDEYSITEELTGSIAPRLESLGSPALGGYRARIYGEPGLSYKIEASPNLVDWETVLDVSIPAGGILDFRDSFVTAPSRFYRLRAP